MNLPMIEARELETAEPGLYVLQLAPNVPIAIKANRTYNVYNDEWVNEPVTLLLLARVRENDGRPLPNGVYDSWVRADGRQVIKAYEAPPQEAE